MPELPEIETIKNGLTEKALKKPILRVAINNASVLHGNKNDFIKILTGREFTNIKRRGKMLIFTLGKSGATEKQYYLLARLGMTGRLVLFGEEDSLWGGESFKDKKSFSHKHCHVVFEFKDGIILLFCDTRRFGYMEIVDTAGLDEKMKSFGPEPLSGDFTLALFRKVLSGKKTNVKALLLNQKHIAGIGNIYADEILFDAGVLPTRLAGNLSADEAKAIYVATKKILKKAVAKRGTTFSDYVDAEGNIGGFKKYLKVYGREGEKCLGCSGKVHKKRLAGRGTHFCPRCQT